MNACRSQILQRFLTAEFVVFGPNSFCYVLAEDCDFGSSLGRLARHPKCFKFKPTTQEPGSEVRDARPDRRSFAVRHHTRIEPKSEVWEAYQFVFDSKKLGSSRPDLVVTDFRLTAD
jgi:hypothetical protein